MKCNIYLITNKINSKKYVGKTTYSLRHRFNQHVSDAKACRYNSALHTAIRKYGENSFEIQLLEICEDCMANDKEAYWINYYNTYKNGYNSTLGGDGKPTLDRPSKDELNQKIKDGWSLRKLANHYNVYAKTVKLWLNSYDIELKTQEISPIKVGCIINGMTLEFESLCAAGNYLVNNGYTLSEPSKAGYNIKRAIERKGTYLGIYWYYI